MNILVVCTGNLCRSPMGEGLLLAALGARGIRDVEVSSAGTWGVDGEPPTRLARTVLSERGVDIGSQTAVTTSVDALRRADLILVMTSVHRREVTQQLPEVATKVILMKELHEMQATGRTPQERLSSLLGAPRPPARRALDLDDPMGLPIGVYERAADEIQAAVGRLVTLLWPEDAP